MYMYTYIHLLGFETTTTTPMTTPKQQQQQQNDNNSKTTTTTATTIAALPLKLQYIPHFTSCVYIPRGFVVTFYSIK